MDLFRTGFSKNEKIGGRGKPNKRYLHRMPTIHPHAYNEMGKNFDTSQPRIKPKEIVYRNGDYYVEKFYLGDEDFYNIGRNGKLAFYNRESLDKSIQELNLWKRASESGEDETNIEHLLVSKTDVQGVDIDKPLRPVIKELNDLGYVTAGSCSGHCGENGFIVFDDEVQLKDSDIKKISNILSKKGIEVILFNKPGNPFDDPNPNGLGEWTPYWSVDFKEMKDNVPSSKY